MLPEKDLIASLKLERDRLKSNLDKLDNFMASDEFKYIDFIEQGYLVDQEYLMTKYLEVLNKRIAFHGR